MSDPIDELSFYLAKLPGLGKRSAKRAVLHLIERKDGLLSPLIDALETVRDKILSCENCGNVDTASPCYICNNPKRATGQICVVESVADLWAIERSGTFRGTYHVLGGVLSALDGIGPDQLRLSSLEERIESEEISELILAMGATLEGQTTGHYILQMLKDVDVSVSQIAQGIPVGGELDYLDEGTLNAAFGARKVM